MKKGISQKEDKPGQGFGGWIGISPGGKRKEPQLLVIKD
jgi:hypothetical protein